MGPFLNLINANKEFLVKVEGFQQDWQKWK